MTQPRVRLIYSVFLLGTHGRAAIWLF